MGVWVLLLGLNLGTKRGMLNLMMPMYTTGRLPGELGKSIPLVLVGHPHVAVVSLVIKRFIMVENLLFLYKWMLTNVFMKK